MKNFFIYLRFMWRVGIIWFLVYRIVLRLDFVRGVFVFLIVGYLVNIGY